MNLLSRIRTLARIRPLPEVERPEVARSVAIILDGNGRWAKRRGLPTAAGHRAGARTVRRGGDALMEICAETIERELPDLAEQGVRVRFIGRRDRAPDELRRRMGAMEDRT